MENITQTPDRIINDSILRGYTSKETAYKVDNYPWGFRLRTSIFYWIETKPKLGDRFCSYTIDPRTGRACKPKCGTYSPFLYMFLSADEGHVKYAGIDSYDKEYFVNRFSFIVEKIGERFISDEQKNNLRLNHLQHLMGSYPYQLVKYSEDMQPVFKAWFSATIKHIKTCDFANLVDYPDRPEENNPDGEIKMTVVERVPVVYPSHSITPELIGGIVAKVLPGFWIKARQYKGFGGEYIGVQMACSDHDINRVDGQKIQKASLTLDIKSLELESRCEMFRQPNEQDPKERFLAMKSIKVPFRRPACNEKDVLNAVQRFAENYKKALIENRAVLKYQDLVNYDELLNLKTIQP